ncbi:MAG: methyltransferase domain-containing protein [Thermodesulfobacteriota bacterium]
MDRQKIKRSFSKAAPTYDASAEVQKDAAARLAGCVGVFMDDGMEFSTHEMNTPVFRQRVQGCVLPAPRPLILDAGCGTGNLMAEVGGRWPHARLVGCDIATPMLEKAKERLADAALAASDCAALPFGDGVFDMVVSNLAFQWVDIYEAFSEAHRTLKPGGLLVFSTLGPDTLSELRTSCSEAAPGVEFPLELRSIDEMESKLEECGLEPLSVDVHPVFKRYAGVLELVRKLKDIGAAPAAPGAGGFSGAVMLRRAGGAYARRFPAPGGAGVIATYEVIFMAARKR